MSEFTQENEVSLLRRLRRVQPGIQYSNQYGSGDSINFTDSCGCYSEWTTESCSLSISICGILPANEKEQYDLRKELEEETEVWAEKHLTWSGCECCGNYLSVWVRFYDVSTEEK
jgi:hypothetical protein